MPESRLGSGNIEWSYLDPDRHNGLQSPCAGTQVGWHPPAVASTLFLAMHKTIQLANHRLKKIYSRFKAITIMSVFFIFLTGIPGCVPVGETSVMFRPAAWDMWEFPTAPSQPLFNHGGRQ